MEYVVVIHIAEEGGFWAEVPALDGCFAQGESVEETLEDARAAISSHIDALREFGDPVPEPNPVILATVHVTPAA